MSFLHFGFFTSEFFYTCVFFLLFLSSNALYYTTLGVLYALGVWILTGFAAHGGLSVCTPWDKIEGWFLAPIGPY